MTQWIVDLIESGGYPVVVLLMLLEIPVPLIQSEIVMTFSGFAASQGDLHPVAVILAGIVGSQLGSLGLYALARQVTEEQANDFLATYGGWLGFTDENLADAQDRFRRHDHWAVLVGRLVPGVRSFIALPAGIQRMPVWEFLGFNVVGTAFWVTVLTVAGWYLGDRFQVVDRYSSYITYGLLAAVALFVGYRLVTVVKQHVEA